MACNDRPIQTRFRYGSSAERINLMLQTITRRIIMQKARGHTGRASSSIVLPQLVSAWFQVLLTPLKEVLFTFQSPYLSTIGRRVVLSLGGWAPRLRTEFHELHATLGHLSTEGCCFRVRGCHPLCPVVPDRSANNAFVTPRGPATPGCKHPGLGYVRLRSPLLTESRLISIPSGTEMFQFPELASNGLYIQP